MCPFIPFVCRTCEAYDMRLGKVCVCVEGTSSSHNATGYEKKKKSNVHISSRMINWNLLPIYPHTCGDKRKIVNRKKKRSLHTHTHRISLGCEAENAGYFIVIKCATRTRAHMCGYVLCMMSFFEKEKREMCQMRARASYFFFADASTLASTWVTFPSMTTPFPSMKATRERPSQFL